LILNCLALCHFALVEADVVVLTQKSNYTVNVFADEPASFGQIIPSEGLVGNLVGASPRNACSPIQPPPTLSNYTGLWFVLIKRYDCNFSDKVRQAQLANYDAAIIHNVGSNSIEPMAGQDADDIDITAIFVGQDDGLTLLAQYHFDKGYKLLLTDDLPLNINNYLIPFEVVVGVCFLTMLLFIVVKCIKDRRRMQRYRLPSSSLKSIPTSKFKKGDPYDTCAICLDDYVDGDKLRILPCSHAYHCKCIDPWLTRNRRVCPVCKRRVLARGEHFSDSDSESESETRPLLRPGGYGTQGGTFQPTMQVNPSDMTSTESTIPLDVEQGHQSFGSIEAVIESQPRDSLSMDVEQEQDESGEETSVVINRSEVYGSLMSSPGAPNRSSTPLDQVESVYNANTEDSAAFFTPHPSVQNDGNETINA